MSDSIPVLDDWQIVAERPQTYGYMKTVGRQYQLPSGDLENWDILLSRPTVAVLASTPPGDVVLTRQFRPGPDRWLQELPGGYVDQGETPLDAARRELIEETGYTPTNVRIVGGFWDSAGSTRYRFAAIATGCTPDGQMSDHDKKRLRVEIVAFDSFIEVLRSGDLTDTHVAYRCLDAYGLIDTTRWLKDPDAKPG